METENQSLSADDIAKYDRQIRVWGMEAQKLLGKAKILISGIGGLGSEVVKNLALAGVKSITLMDTENITEEDLNSQLLITPNFIGQNRAEASAFRTQELNPNVIVEISKDNINSKCDEFFKNFDVVCVTNCSQKVRVKVDIICRMHRIKFFCGDIVGFFGYCFSDIGVHNFVEEKEVLKSSAKSSTATSNIHKKEEYEKVLVKNKEEFCSLEEALSEDWSKRSKRDLRYSSPIFFFFQAIEKFHERYNRTPQRSEEDKGNLLKICTEVLQTYGMKEDYIPSDYVEFCYSELNPVCAIVGGVLSQEIIKTVTCRDAPINNHFFFNGLNHSGIVDRICPNKC